MRFLAGSPPFHGSEWTWFTKGLRLLYAAPTRAVSLLVRMDLIYEGITTRTIFCCQWTAESEWTWFTKGLRRRLSVDMKADSFRQNGPDLRRDYDEGVPLHCCTAISVRMDLIYEGITTWLDVNIEIFFRPSQKGPDLRRDYDAVPVVIKFCSTKSQKGPDLRRDYDQRTSSGQWPVFSVRKDLIYEGITTGILWMVLKDGENVRKDLIYEGITTIEEEVFFASASSQKGPDLRRDYDPILPIFLS